MQKIFKLKFQQLWLWNKSFQDLSNFIAPKKLFGIEINEETFNEAIKRGLKLGIKNISFSSKDTTREIIDSLELDKNTT